MKPDPSTPLGFLFIVGIFVAILLYDEFKINKTKKE